MRGGHEKPICRGDCLKRGGGLGQFVDSRGAWQERGGGVFEGGGVDTPMSTMYYKSVQGTPTI